MKKKSAKNVWQSDEHPTKYGRIEPLNLLLQLRIRLNVMSFFPKTNCVYVSVCV